MTSPIAIKVAARYQRAYVFPTPEALKDYLHEHPKADPSNHSVKKTEHKEEHHDEPKMTWKDMAKHLSSKAKDFLKKAPGQVKKFVEDEEHRAATLIKAHKAILKAPEKYVKSAFESAKHEVKEFKEAGQGIGAWMKGKKMSKHQAKAFRTVATHVAIAAVGGALGAGMGAGAAGIAKGILGSFVSSTSKKIAVKAVTKHLQHLPLFEEMGHIGHHGVELVSTLMEKLAADKPDADEIMQALIAAAVAKELKELDPSTVQEAIEEAAGV